MAFLELADGTRVDPNTGTPLVPKADLPSLPPSNEPFDPDEPVTSAVRRLEDLPVDAKQMNAICVILGYSFLGLNYWEIAKATNLDEDRLRNLQFSEVYKEVQHMMLDGILELNQDSLRARFALESHRAAEKMFGLLESDSENTVRKAAADVLDRGGHRPADVHEHNVNIQEGLTIEVIQRDERKSTPTIEMEPL